MQGTTSMALGISKIALGRLSFCNWYGIKKKKKKKVLGQNSAIEKDLSYIAIDTLELPSRNLTI